MIHYPRPLPFDLPGPQVYTNLKLMIFYGGSYELGD